MRYVFGRCRLDTSSRVLTRDGVAVPLSLKAFELLKLLIEARPRVLTTAELMEQLWPGALVVEANLPLLVDEVRMATGDQAAAAGVIKTHHGVGYSFVSEGREARPDIDATAPGPVFVLRVGSRRVVLGPGISTVGRDHDGDVFLNDPSVSRVHARIIVANGAATVEDLKSKNGTCVQNVAIAAPTVLTDGDEIEFGSVKVWFIVERPDDPTTLSL